MRTNSPPLIVAISLSISLIAFADESIVLKPDTTPPMSGHLKMGGKDPQGHELNVNSQSLTLDGQPIYPVMGEFHYSRVPRQDWERELLKMKAGGLTVISAYIFWNHHEEVEDQWDWTGNKNLHDFVALCAKHDLKVWLRLGPWDHGEARNGGFPDWLFTKVQRVHSAADPQYMDYVKQLYTQIYQQVQGMLYKDGGPIIGVQVDNEVRGDPGYLLALKNMAQQIGFDVPYYSMTGWGPARVPQDELLPMFGGYSDGFWIVSHKVDPAARLQFFFTHNPNDERRTMTTPLATLPPSMAYLSRYPFLCCECAGGMAIAYARRPLMSWKDVAAEAVCKVGEGSNLMGYYMYHGGQDPVGKLTSLQETELSQYTNSNDMPPFTYDFQAPLGQFGQVRESYHALNLIHQFLADYGPELCTMPSVLPSEMPTDMTDTQTLRWAARSDGHKGFIFINNYQRLDSLSAKTAQFTLHTADADLQIPTTPTQIPADSFMIWPFNLDLNGTTLRYSTAQLICRVDDGGKPVYVFFAPDGVNPEFAFDAKTFNSIDAGAATRKDDNDLAIFDGFVPGPGCIAEIKTADGKSARILLLSQDEAMHLYRADMWGQSRLFRSDASLIFGLTGNDTVTAYSDNPTDMGISVYPAPASVLGAGSPDGIFTHYALSVPAKDLKLDVKQISAGSSAPAIKMSAMRKPLPLPPDDAAYDSAATWQISIPQNAFDGVSEVMLKVDYVGDAARAYVGNKFVDDDFYFGKPWEIGLERFAPDVLTKGLTIKIIPMRKDSPAILDPGITPQFDANGQALEMRDVEAEVEYQATIPAAKP